MKLGKEGRKRRAESGIHVCVSVFERRSVGRRLPLRQERSRFQSGLCSAFRRSHLVCLDGAAAAACFCPQTLSLSLNSLQVSLSFSLSLSSATFPPFTFVQYCMNVCICIQNISPLFPVYVRNLSFPKLSSLYHLSVTHSRLKVRPNEYVYSGANTHTHTFVHFKRGFFQLAPFFI